MHAKAAHGYGTIAIPSGGGAFPARESPQYPTACYLPTGGGVPRRTHGWTAGFRFFQQHILEMSMNSADYFHFQTLHRPLPLPVRKSFAPAAPSHRPCAACRRAAVAVSARDAPNETDSREVHVWRAPHESALLRPGDSIVGRFLMGTRTVLRRYCGYSAFRWLLQYPQGCSKGTTTTGYSDGTIGYCGYSAFRVAATVRSSADGSVASPPRADAAGVPKQAAHLFLRGDHEGLARLRPLFGPQDVSQVCKSIAATKPPKQPWHWASPPWHWAAQAVKHPNKQRRKAEAEPIRRPKRKAEPETNGANRNPIWYRCAAQRRSRGPQRRENQNSPESERGPLLIIRIVLLMPLLLALVLVVGGCMF